MREGRAPTIGLPRMHKEAGDVRDFLPEFVAFANGAGAGEIVLERGYGSGMGIEPTEYLSASASARFGSLEECLEQDVVLVIRCPEEDALRGMRSGALLVSMLHYPTRPERTKLIERLDLRAVSLDLLVDDTGRRLVENLEAVGWNGVRAAFGEIARTHPHLSHPGRRPFQVTCLGAGAVGGHAVRAATRYGDPDLRRELAANHVPGVEVTVADFDLTRHEEYMVPRLERTDLLIDATQRVDPSAPVVPNHWLAALPPDAVLLDLAVDPYDLDSTPPKVKGIEGVPHGNLDRYVFAPDDPVYDRMDPRIDTRNRRLALSCYAWPGLHPRECMELYGAQIRPAIELILAAPPEGWSVDSGSHVERAVARAELRRWRST